MCPVAGFISGGAVLWKNESVQFETECIGFPVDSNTLWFHTYEWNYIPKNEGGTGLSGGIYTESRAIK